MQTWTRRGVSTALVTGGLLMLGTGIATADENVNPDRPASPIDAGIGDLANPTGVLAAPAVRTPVGAIPATTRIPSPAAAVPQALPVPAPASAAVPSGAQEATSLSNPQPAGGDRATGSGATRSAGIRPSTRAVSDPTAEWRTLTGDLAHVPPPNLTQLAADGVAALSRRDPATVFRVPAGVLGQAVDRPARPAVQSAPASDVDKIKLPAGVDDLLQAVQVPRFTDLFGHGVSPTGPLTTIFPAITDATPRPARIQPQDLTPNAPALPVPALPVPGLPVPGLSTVAAPRLPIERSAPVPDPHFAPMSGELPLGGQLVPPAAPPAGAPLAVRLPVLGQPPAPAMGTPGVPGLAPFQGLPPLPTLPPMPAIPKPSPQDLPTVPLPTVPVSSLTRSGLATSTVNPSGAPTLPALGGAPTAGSTLGAGHLPTTQSRQADQARQLIAELRNLTSELAGRANGAPAPLYPMNPAVELPDLPPSP